MGTLLFVTGKLAEPALRRTVAGLSERFGFRSDVAVLPITVVALAPTEWIARHLTPPSGVDRVVIPGLCSGELAVLSDAWPGIDIRRGPKDLLDLPDFFGLPQTRPDGYGEHDIEILAEINHAPRLPFVEILAKARQACADGADVIDLGCDPDGPWTGVADTVRALRDEGVRVSIDTFDVVEAAAAAKAGAELVLSVNRTNRHAARDWGVEVVVVPDEAGTLDGIDDTLAVLEGVPHRLDPILEPIGFGFARSLVRYAEVRRRYPDAEMLMGVGNLTELTGVDSAGMNVALAGYCQELGIRSVLTTEVINWSRSCVRELDLARRLVAYAVKNRVLPKRLEPDLVMLRDPRLRERGAETLAELAATITDQNFRLFAERGLIHVLAKGLHLEGDNPYELFAKMLESRPIDASHAFYLGCEMAKARIALTLGKNYVQDQALRWGMLTREERPGGHA
jgi:dihydropteroate synthase-like protein